MMSAPMNAVFLIVLLGANADWTQPASDHCCNCGRGSSRENGAVVCLNAKEMRGRVDHIEPLKHPGLEKGLNLSGTVVLEIRFGTDGKVACARARSGHPIAISAAMEAIPKWTFKAVLMSGSRKGGCGRITIKYRLRDQGSSTDLG